MKKFLTLQIIFLMMSVFIPIEMKADIPDQNLTFLVYKFIPSYSEYEKNTGPDGKRCPAHPMLCTVSLPEGISVAGYANDFSSYEIWDADGEICVSVFTDEYDFIDELFSMTGEFQIRFISEDFVFIGYISTNI